MFSPSSDERNCRGMVGERWIERWAPPRKVGLEVRGLVCLRRCLKALSDWGSEGVSSSCHWRERAKRGPRPSSPIASSYFRICELGVFSLMLEEGGRKNERKRTYFARAVGVEFEREAGAAGMRPAIATDHVAQLAIHDLFFQVEDSVGIKVIVGLQSWEVGLAIVIHSR